MDACHLLLGRPWKFDRRTMHDGYHNTYSITMDQKKITLLPLSAPATSRPLKDAQSQIPKQVELIMAVQGNEHMYVLMNLEERMEVEATTHPLVKRLIQEFEDVFPKEMPGGLPPLRDIQHQIDLISGVTLPNRLGYRCNLEEAKELQRQVEELIRVRKSQPMFRSRNPRT
ncbi:hypothetical protein MLD38_040348 [Melastoma candidum]|uniref:Uncharacterized protein n=1 Tax=Melastoma candidum TaxID=119954 RepID=A0ACB9L6B2_9MYRT|nr:hypothetical protein MLD38_040348 [Melastoma candidum]